MVLNDYGANSSMRKISYPGSTIDWQKNFDLGGSTYSFKRFIEFDNDFLLMGNTGDTSLQNEADSDIVIVRVAQLDGSIVSVLTISNGGSDYPQGILKQGNGFLLSHFKSPHSSLSKYSYDSSTVTATI